MFILQEIQSSNAGTNLLPAVVHGERQQAESAYYMTLSAAAISSVPVHTVMLYDEHGNIIKRDTYEHT